MKQAYSLILIACSFASCTSSTPPETKPAEPAKDTVAAATPAITFPYTATYSSQFVPGKPEDVLTVLNNYKAWEDNDMKGLRATVGDSLEIVFSNGQVIKGKSDSLIIGATKLRNSLSKVALTIYVWTSNHSVDKNQDWVNVWYKEVDTYKTGKIDSAEYEDDNLLKDGKIVWVSSHEQKFPKKK